MKRISIERLNLIGFFLEEKLNVYLLLSSGILVIIMVNKRNFY